MRTPRKEKRWPGVTRTTSRHGNIVYYFRSYGRSIRLPAPTDDEFEAAYEAAKALSIVPHVRDMAKTAAHLRKQKTEKALIQRLRSCRNRRRVKGMPFDLTIDWLLEKAEEQNFCCALTGIEFFAEHGSLGVKNPYSPSLDRIDPKKGYTTDNVRLVIFAINSMLLDWGERVFEQVFKSFEYQKRTKWRQSIEPPDSRWHSSKTNPLEIREKIG